MDHFSADFRARRVMWRIAHHLVTERRYRIVDLFETGDEFYEKLPSGLWELSGAEEPSELFLVRNQGRKFYLVRLLAADFVWPRQLQEDLERIRELAALFKQRVVARRLDVQNIYLMSYVTGPELAQALASGRGQDRWLTVSHWILDLSARRIIGSGPERPPLPLERLAVEGLSSPFDGQAEQWKFEIREALERQEAYMQAVFSRGRPFWTYVLLGINIGLFLLMTLTGGTTNPENLIRFGAKFHPAIWAGEWWRFITPVFIHIGLAHLLFNSVALYFLGSLVERIYGSGRFFLAYFAAGAMGVASSFAFSPHLSAGASSAIFGLFGALLFFGQNYRDLFFQTIGMEILTLLGINLVFGIFSSGVDNYAHLGGLVGGYLAANVLGLPKVKAGIPLRLGALVLFVALFVWLYQRGFSWL